MSNASRCLQSASGLVARKQWPRIVSRQRIPVYHSFHSSASLAVVKPYLLADIGEGIKEVQIIQWFVKPGARVEQFDKLCEVQSDKAATEITSRFDGVIKKLYYEAEDMAQVGKPLCDIDIQSEISPLDEALVAPTAELTQSGASTERPQEAEASQTSETSERTPTSKPEEQKPSRHASLATPAVRGILKELSVKIEDVTGTGRDGRVLKEDVQKFVNQRESAKSSDQPAPSSGSKPTNSDSGPQKESIVSLRPIQAQMFKTMTKSLSIPHFLYGDDLDFSTLAGLRRRINAHSSPETKLSFLPFVVKAVSIALQDFPLLNARVDLPGDGSAPKLVMREKHNIGVAMDTPQGLLVPNIKNVALLSVAEIAAELRRLQSIAKAGKLSANDLTGGTITVSNIGNIGGTYVSPIIVQSEVAILGMGKIRDVPAFGADGGIVKKSMVQFSWSADHRVVDGATMARMGERVRALLEEPGFMIAAMR